MTEKPTYLFREKAWVCPILVLLIGIGVTLFGYFFMLNPQAPFFWDEAHHAKDALNISHSLSEGDWSLFGKISNSLILWPFMHSWFTGAFMSVFGVTISNARLASLIFCLPSIWLIYLICRDISPGDGRLIGLLAVLLFGTSPLVLFLSSACMIEMLGVFITLSFFKSYFSALDSGKQIFFMIAGLLVGLLYLTKYSFGLLIFFATGINALYYVIVVEKARRIPFLINFIILGIVALVPVGIWLACGHFAEKLHMVSYYIGSGTGATILEISGFDRALFYIRSLANIYSFSIWIFLIYIGGIVIGITLWKNAKVRFLLSTSLIIPIICTIGRNQQDRYLILAFPGFAILGAVFIVKVFDKFKSRQLKRMFALILLGLIILDLPGYPAHCRRIAQHTIGSCRYPVSREFEYSICLIPGAYPNLLKQPYSYLNPEADYAIAEHDMGDVWEFIVKNVGERNYVCCLTGFQEFSPHFKQWSSYNSNVPILSYWEPRARYFVYLDIGSRSPYFNKEYRRAYHKKNLRWIGHLENLKKRGFLLPVGSRSYPDIAARVKIFRKTEAFNQALREEQ
jgi:Dolichyl-phosphate-mannose-protein mannosyltransferase